MNYIKEINAFRNHLKTNPLEATTQALWYVIIDYHNSCGWETWITIDNSRLVAELGVSEKTLISHRNKLIQAGVLEYKSQQRKKNAGRYNLLSFEAGEVGKKKTTEQSTGTITADKKVDNKTTVNITADREVDRVAVEGADRVADPSDLNKLNETKLNNKEKDNVIFHSQAKESGVIKKDVQDIFDYYCETFTGYYQRISLTKKRETHIKSRLKNFSVDDIKRSIANIRKSSFHLGENDSSMFYATIEFICRNDETVEKWMNHVPKQQAKGQTSSGQAKSKFAAYDRQQFDFDELERREQEHIDQLLGEGAS